MQHIPPGLAFPLYAGTALLLGSLLNLVQARASPRRLHPTQARSGARRSRAYTLGNGCTGHTLSVGAQRMRCMLHVASSCTAVTHGWPRRTARSLRSHAACSHVAANTAAQTTCSPIGASCTGNGSGCTVAARVHWSHTGRCRCVVHACERASVFVRARVCVLWCERASVFVSLCVCVSHACLWACARVHVCA